MKSIIISILLSFLIQFCYCQDQTETIISNDLMQMEKILKLTDLQKENILEIFKNYFIEKNAINKNMYDRYQDYNDALIKLYANMKKTVYNELTDKQLLLLEEFKSQRLEMMKLKAIEDTQAKLKNHK